MPIRSARSPLKLAAGIIATTALMLQAACFPYKYTARAALSGTVLNSADGRPIAGAVVTDPESPTYRTTTAEDGSFFLEPERKWGIWFIVPQEPLSSGRLEIEAEGYERAEIQVSGWRSEASIETPIRLEPVSRE